MRGRCEPDNEEARFRVPEPGYGLAPVFLATVGRAFFPRGPLPVADEAGTPAAGGYGPAEGRKAFFHGGPGGRYCAGAEWSRADAYSSMNRFASVRLALRMSHCPAGRGMRKLAVSSTNILAGS